MKGGSDLCVNLVYFVKIVSEMTGFQKGKVHFQKLKLHI